MSQCIFRSFPSRDYVSFPNATARDRSLSFRARGLLVMVMSHSNEWVIHQGWLATQGTEGREAIRAAMKELEMAGYAIHDIARENGVILGSRWSFYDLPRPAGERTNRTRWKSETPQDGLPSDGKPSDGFLPPIEEQETEDQKTEHQMASGKRKKGEVVEEKEKKGRAAYEEFKAYWNENVGEQSPQIRMYSEKRARELSARLKNPDWRENWKAAVDKIKDCPFLTGENDRKWTADAEFFLRPDTVAKIIEGKYDAKEEDPYKKYLC